jgi:shikimate kinase
MIVLLFGVSGVGKTSVGEKLAEKLQCPFFDLDDEIKRTMNTTLEQFMKDYPFSHERFKIKGKILKDLINNQKSHAVIAVCPIYHARNFNALLDSKKIFAIELLDTAENIFDRLVFSDENDHVYKDDEYKEKHRAYYINDIRQDMSFTKKVYKKIVNKYFVDNQPVEQVVEALWNLILDRNDSEIVSNTLTNQYQN